MPTILVPADFPTIQLAVNASAPADTIEISAGTYLEQVTAPHALTFKGATGAYADVIVRWTDTVFAVPAGSDFEDLRIVCAAINPTRGCIDGFNTGNVVTRRCRLDSSGYAIRRTPIVTVERCWFQYGGGVLGAIAGITADSGNIEASYFQGFRGPAVFHTFAAPILLVRNNTVYNCAVNGTTPALQAFLVENNLVYACPGSGIDSATTDNNISWANVGADYVQPKAANDLDSADVAADGRPIFVSPVDYHLAGLSLATYSGLLAGILLDLDGVAYNVPPSRGCYELVVASQKRKVRARLTAMGTENFFGGGLTLSVANKQVANLPVLDEKSIIMNIPASSLSAGAPIHSGLRAAMLAVIPDCLEENIAGLLISSSAGADILIGSTTNTPTAQDEGLLIPADSAGYLPMKDTVPTPLTYQSASAVDIVIFFL